MRFQAAYMIGPFSTYVQVRGASTKDMEPMMYGNFPVPKFAWESFMKALEAGGFELINETPKG